MRGPMRGPSSHWLKSPMMLLTFWVQTHMTNLCWRAVVGEQALKLKGDFTWEESVSVCVLL